MRVARWRNNPWPPLRFDRGLVNRRTRISAGPHVFLRAFAEFSYSELPQQLHQALIQNSYEKDMLQDQLVGHITRDSTAIEVRERAASLHDWQVAIPLATITAHRVTSLYAVMDAAYDAKEIREHCQELGQLPLIDPVHRAVPIPHRTQQASLRGYDKRRKLPKTTPGKLPPFTTAQEERYRIRTMSERVNGRLKDEFGGRTIRVRGASKVGSSHVRFARR